MSAYWKQSEPERGGWDILSSCDFLPTERTASEFVPEEKFTLFYRFLIHSPLSYIIMERH